MTTAVDTLIKYQKTYNKKHTQEEADGLVQKATMAERRRGPPSRGRPYIWPPRITDAESAEAMAERRRRLEDWNMITQEDAGDLVQEALMPRPRRNPAALLRDVARSR